MLLILILVVNVKCQLIFLLLFSNVAINFIIYAQVFILKQVIIFNAPNAKKSDYLTLKPTVYRFHLGTT